MATSHNKYANIDPDIEAQIDELMAKMSIHDKIGQMCQDGLTQDNEENKKRCLSGAVGSVICYFSPEEMNELQKDVIENSPLGIPLLIAGDVIHGYNTTFPIPLAESCSFSPVLAERTARAAAEEASARGIHLILAPMVDIARDGRWGRIAEGSGEDCLLGCELSAARTRGFQAANLKSNVKTAACPKHYIGYGAAEAGRDYNSVDMSENLLRDMYLPPFKASFDEGAAVVMSAFHDLNGVPCSANKFTLKDILIDEFKWEGFVLSDYNAVAELIAHGIAADEYEASVKAINSGVHMDMGPGLYYKHLPKAVENGDVSIETIDDAVRRILRLKFQLGLFDNPYVDTEVAARVTLSAEHRKLAYEAACNSIVLLKNENEVLPVSNEVKRIAVVGPLANDTSAPLGCWSCRGREKDVTTVFEGLRSAAPSGVKVDYIRGCEVEEPCDEDISNIIAVAEQADLIVAVLGEDRNMSGEAQCRAYIDLPGDQQMLLEMLAATGKPVALVLLNGRPLVLSDVEPNVDAIVEAWHGGIATGDAVASVLFGEVNPSGKLAATFPRCEGQLPIFYNIRATGRPAWGEGTTQFDEPYKSRYRDEYNSPMYPFGYGLSYTTFTYEALKIHTPSVTDKDTLSLSVEITNTGEYSGKETIQLYVKDCVGSMARPIKELKAFKQITLEPGESQTVYMELPINTIGFYNADMEYVVEPGKFEVFVGPCSDRGLKGEFTVVE